MTTTDLTAAVNRLTALCEYFELHGEWPGNRSDSNDIADVRAVLGEREQLAARIAELEAEHADTGSTHRELLARTYCAVCGKRRTSLAHLNECMSTEGA